MKHEGNLTVENCSVFMLKEFTIQHTQDRLTHGNAVLCLSGTEDGVGCDTVWGSGFSFDLFLGSVTVRPQLESQIWSWMERERWSWGKRGNRAGRSRVFVASLQVFFLDDFSPSFLLQSQLSWLLVSVCPGSSFSVEKGEGMFLLVQWVITLSIHHGDLAFGRDPLEFNISHHADVPIPAN